MSSHRRMTFKGGWWADVRLMWPYGADARIAGTWGFTNDTEGFERACMVTLQESVIDAHLPDINGEAVPFGPEMWGKVDGRIARKLLNTCRENWGKWQQDSDPKDTEETSGGSPQESPSPSELD